MKDNFAIHITGPKGIEGSFANTPNFVLGVSHQRVIAFAVNMVDPCTMSLIPPNSIFHVKPFEDNDCPHYRSDFSPKLLGSGKNF